MNCTKKPKATNKEESIPRIFLLICPKWMRLSPRNTQRTIQKKLNNLPWRRHLPSSSVVSCKTFSSLSLLRPATAHLNFPLQFLATSLTTNWPVNPLAPNTTMENCLSALAMFCFSFQQVVGRRGGTGEEFTLWLLCIMGRCFQHGGHEALSLGDVAK